MSTGLPVGTFIIRWVARLGCGGAEAGWDASRRHYRKQPSSTPQLPTK
jgi:hypothetical protein